MVCTYLGGSNVAAQKAGKYAGMVFTGAVLAGCALGLAANAQADNCDPFLLSMTPQPVLSCQAPEVAPPPAEIAPPPAEVPAPAEPGPFGLVEAPPPPLPDGSVG
jgi:hypothetical protein